MLATVTKAEKQERTYTDGALSGTSHVHNFSTLSSLIPLVNVTYTLVIRVIEVEVG
jgi:hypothetical protein